MKRLIIFLIPMILAAQQTSLLECNKIFEERKQELEMKLDQIDDQTQAYEALKNATEAMLKKRESILKQKELDLNATQNKIEQEKKNIQNLIAENKKLLDAIKNAKMNKLSQTYAKMKAAAAAQILSDMKPSSAAKILSSLKPRVVGKILAKMDSQKASAITLLLERH